jgi:hypothetical protein
LLELGYQARRKQGADIWEPVLMAPAPERNSILNVIVPADGTRAATVGNGDFGTSPIFGQLSGKPPPVFNRWGVGLKAQ